MIPLLLILPLLGCADYSATTTPDSGGSAGYSDTPISTAGFSGSDNNGGESGSYNAGSDNGGSAGDNNIAEGGSGSGGSGVGGSGVGGSGVGGSGVGGSGVGGSYGGTGSGGVIHYTSYGGYTSDTPPVDNTPCKSYESYITDEWWCDCSENVKTIEYRWNCVINVCGSASTHRGDTSCLSVPVTPKCDTGYIDDQLTNTCIRNCFDTYECTWTKENGGTCPFFDEICQIENEICVFINDTYKPHYQCIDGTWIKYE
jgi:hypothetical protein